MWHLGWSEVARGEGDESPVIAASGTSVVVGVGGSIAAATGEASGTSGVTGLSPPGIQLGRAHIRQKIYHDPLETDDIGGTLTTWATDLTVASIDTGTDTLTFGADHGMITAEGPYTWLSTGTYPSVGGVPIVPSDKFWIIRDLSTTCGLATSGQNAKAGTRVNFSSAGTGTHTLVRTITTRTTGSAFLLLAALGTWSLSPEDPTDNKGNTYSALAGSPTSYLAFVNSKAGVWGVSALTGIGGNAHTGSKTWAQESPGSPTSSDEPTVALLEIVGGNYINSAVQKETAIGSATITSNTVYAEGPAILVAVIFGNGPVGQNHAFTWGSGFARWDEASSTADTSTNGYIQIDVATKEVSVNGHYSFSADGVSTEGGQMFLFAIMKDRPTGSAAGTSSVEATGSSVAAAAGNAAGTSTVSGAAFQPAGVGDAAGTSTPAAVGTAIVGGAGAASGSSSVAAIGAATSDATGAASGISTAAATGATTAAATGAGAGTSTPTATGAATTAATGAAAGTSTPTAAGGAVGAGAGAASGTSTATTTGAATAASLGAAAGTSAPTAVGGATAGGAGASAGASSVAAVGGAIAAGAGASTGTSTATATGASLAAGVGTGSAAGTSTAAASGASTAAAPASSSGSGTAAASGEATSAGTGASVGTSVPAATGGAVVSATGLASGTAAVAAEGGSEAGVASTGSAEGTSTATGAGAAIISSTGAAAGAGTGTATSPSIQELPATIRVRATSILRVTPTRETLRVTPTRDTIRVRLRVG